MAVVEHGDPDGATNGGDWLVTTYEPTALFSLRASNATSSGGKTLLVPSPYAVKLAIVDAGIRIGGVAHGRELFELVRSRPIRLRPPRYAVVNNTFQRVLRQRRGGGEDDQIDGQDTAELGAGPFERTIAYREFCHFEGLLDVGIGVHGLLQPQRTALLYSFAHINYFGKRGSFMQFLRAATLVELPSGFSVPFGEHELPQADPAIFGTPQMLDDLGAGGVDLFERINTYSAKRITNQERIPVYTLLPYRQRASTRRYTAFTYSDAISREE